MITITLGGGSTTIPAINRMGGDRRVGHTALESVRRSLVTRNCLPQEGPKEHRVRDPRRPRKPQTLTTYQRNHDLVKGVLRVVTLVPRTTDAQTRQGGSGHYPRWSGVRQAPWTNIQVQEDGYPLRSFESIKRTVGPTTVSRVIFQMN